MYGNISKTVQNRHIYKRRLLQKCPVYGTLRKKIHEVSVTFWHNGISWKTHCLNLIVFHSKSTEFMPRAYHGKCTDFLYSTEFLYVPRIREKWFSVRSQWPLKTHENSVVLKTYLYGCRQQIIRLLERVGLQPCNLYCRPNCRTLY